MSDDVEVGDQGMTMAECENLIDGLKAKNGEQEAELAKLRKPSIFKRIATKLPAVLLPALLIASAVSIIGLGVYGEYYNGVVKPNQLAGEAAQGPTITDEQLMRHLNDYISDMRWDEKQVLRVYPHQNADYSYIHLNQDDYNLLKVMIRVDIAQLLQLREMKRKLKGEAPPTPVQNKVRTEY